MPTSPPVLTEEVALWITLLLSPMASFMTGAVIPLDGVRSLTVSSQLGLATAAQLGQRGRGSDNDGGTTMAPALGEGMP